MAAAAAKTNRYLEWVREHPETLASMRKTANERHPCKIKDCKRTAYKGELCKGHWDQVPAKDRIALQIAVMEAQRREAAKHHRRLRRELQARLAA